MHKLSIYTLKFSIIFRYNTANFDEKRKFWASVFILVISRKFPTTTGLFEIKKGENGRKLSGRKVQSFQIHWSTEKN